MTCVKEVLMSWHTVVPVGHTGTSDLAWCECASSLINAAEGVGSQLLIGPPPPLTNHKAVDSRAGCRTNKLSVGRRFGPFCWEGKWPSVAVTPEMVPMIKRPTELQASFLRVRVTFSVRTLWPCVWLWSFEHSCARVPVNTTYLTSLLVSVVYVI